MSNLKDLLSTCAVKRILEVSGAHKLSEERFAAAFLVVVEMNQSLRGSFLLQSSKRHRGWLEVPNIHNSLFSHFCLT